MTLTAVISFMLMVLNQMIEFVQAVFEANRQILSLQFQAKTIVITSFGKKPRSSKSKRKSKPVCTDPVSPSHYYMNHCFIVIVTFIFSLPQFAHNLFFVPNLHLLQCCCLKISLSQFFYSTMQLVQYSKWRLGYPLAPLRPEGSQVRDSAFFFCVCVFKTDF
jgi:hypothetical protein